MVGTDISYQKHVREVISTQKTVISDVFMSKQGYLAIAMHVPFFKGNEFAGSLAILIPIDMLGRLYLDKIKIKGNGKAWLLSENGIELYCPVKGHIGKSFLENAHNDHTAIHLLEQIRSETSGTAWSADKVLRPDGKTRSIKKYIAFYRAPLGNTYWTILISRNESDIYFTLTRLRNRIILLFSLFLLIISFYFYSIVKVRNVLKEEAKRKKAEKTLQESEEKFRRIFEDHSAIKLLIDPAGKYYRCKSISRCILRVELSGAEADEYQSDQYNTLWRKSKTVLKKFYRKKEPSLNSGISSKTDQSVMLRYLPAG